MIVKLEAWLFWLAAGLGAVAVGLVVFLTRSTRRPEPVLNTRTVEQEREALSVASGRLSRAEEQIREVESLPDDERSHALAGALRRGLRGGAGEGTSLIGILCCYAVLAVVLCGLATFCSGCIREAPPVFSAAVPVMEEPKADFDFTTTDACPRVEPFIPGRPVPYSIDGIAACRAQLIPEQQAADMLYAGVRADYWEDMAKISAHYREIDRMHAEAVAAQRWEDAQIQRRQVTAHQVLLPVAVTLAVVVGIFAGRATP